MVLETKLGTSALLVCSIPRPPHLELWILLAVGSSAGAGSGEFHVYRHLRRREYQRQDYMDAMAEKASEPWSLVTLVRLGTAGCSH